MTSPLSRTAGLTLRGGAAVVARSGTIAPYLARIPNQSRQLRLNQRSVSKSTQSRILRPISRDAGFNRRPATGIATPNEPSPPRGINVQHMTTTTTTAPLPTDIGGRLRHYRNRCGYSREQAAELIGRRPGAINDYERGQRTPTLQMLHKLADVYGVSIVQLLGPDWQ